MFVCEIPAIVLYTVGMATVTSRVRSGVCVCIMIWFLKNPHKAKIVTVTGTLCNTRHATVMVQSG